MPIWQNGRIYDTADPTELEFEDWYRTAHSLTSDRTDNAAQGAWSGEGLNNLASAAGGQGLLLMFWFRISAWSGLSNQNIGLCRDATATTGFVIQRSGTTNNIITQFRGATPATATIAFTPNNSWNHFAVKAHTGNTFTAWLNGTGTTSAAAVPTTALPRNINFALFAQLGCNISDVAVWRLKQPAAVNMLDMIANHRRGVPACFLNPTRRGTTLGVANLVYYNPCFGLESLQNWVDNSPNLNLRTRLTNVLPSYERSPVRHPTAITPLRSRVFITDTTVAESPIDGTSSLTFDATGDLIGDGDLVGDSSLTFAATGTLVGDAPATGTSSLTFSTTATLVGSTDGTGTSSLTFATSGTLVGSALGTGSSSLTFATSGTLVGTALATGTSSLTFASTSSLSGSAPGAGASTLTFAASATGALTAAATGTSSLTFVTSGSVAGSGELSASSSLTFTASSTLSGSAPATGASSLTFSTSGTLTGDGAITGSEMITFATTATASGSAVANGTSSLTFTNSAVLTELTAAVPTSITKLGPYGGPHLKAPNPPTASSLTFATSGTVTGDAFAAGTSSSSFATNGTLSGQGNANSTSALAFSTSATLTGRGALEGSTSITLVPAATIGQLNLLSGIVSLVISASGLLDQAVVLIEGLEPPLRAPESLDYAPIVAASSVDYTPSSAAQGVDYAPGTAAQSTDYTPGKAAQPSDYIPITRRKG